MSPNLLRPLDEQVAELERAAIAAAMDRAEGEAREAEAAIRRAREGTAREGNVYRPKSFDRPRGDDDTLH